MHISFLLSAFHSASAGGGAESYVSAMADALLERGHRVSVIALGEPGVRNGRMRMIQVARPNLHWFLYRGLPFAKSFAMPVREIEWSRCAWSALAELNQQDPVDLVETGENIALHQSAPGEKPPVVVRGHGNALSIKRVSGKRVAWGDRLGRRLQLAGMRRANAITAVSKFQARELGKDLSLPEAAIHVIPNPISPMLLKRALEQPRVEPAKPVVLYTGRIELNKGSLELLRSVNQVASRFPDVEYVMAGGRHNSIDDHSLASALGKNATRDHVRLLGHVPWQQLADSYRRASVFVMPSYYETFGISVIEAMAFGLPVVATNVGGLPEVVEDGVTGILVPPGNADALADAIVQLLRDPDLRARLGHAGRERVRSEFTIDRVVSQTLAVYESVIRN
ncbi:MAG TPA: glycosyltransferase family 4 protein [Pyrinomonadaceae bacterium]|jgi:glycosyltransferase involved in cell wall biosynthesis